MYLVVAMDCIFQVESINEAMMAEVDAGEADIVAVQDGEFFRYLPGTHHVSEGEWVPVEGIEDIFPEGNPYIEKE